MIKMKIILSLLLVFVILSTKAQVNQTTATLTIGDDVPRLEVHKWLKGTPIQQFEKGKVYVVEFWATWCGPCIMAMPHLSALARQYKDKVDFVGVSVWENTGKKVPDVATIQRFVDEKGSDMDYNVAMDDPNTNKVANAWLKAAGLNGIPATFVVNSDGKIAWIGHPLKVDTILQEIVNNSANFDLKSVKEKYNQEQEKQAKQQAAKKVLGYGMSKNYGLAFHEMQRLAKEDPAFETDNFWVVVQAYLNFNGKLAVTYVQEKSKDADFLKTMKHENEITGDQLLDIFARFVVEQPGLEIDMYYDAVRQLQDAVQREPNNYLVQSFLAQGYARLNEPDKAVLIQEKVLARFQDDVKSKPEEEQKMIGMAQKRIESKLEEYKKLKEKKAALL